MGDLEDFCETWWGEFGFGVCFFGDLIGMNNCGFGEVLFSLCLGF